MLVYTVYGVPLVMNLEAARCVNLAKSYVDLAVPFFYSLSNGLCLKS
jgi:hypothetical protein